MRGKSIVLSIFVLLLFTPAVFADEEEARGGSSLPGLIADGSVAVAKGTAWTAEAAFWTTHYGMVKTYRATKYGLKEGAGDGTRAVYDGAKWAVHQTPANYGRYTWRGTKWAGVNAGKQALKTPGYIASGLSWLTGLKIGKR